MINSDGENTFIVPGGSTPHLFYQHLAEKVTDWSDVTLIPSDERLVDETSAESTIGMIRKTLMQRIGVRDMPTLFSIIDGIIIPKSDQVLATLNSKLKNRMPAKAVFLGIGRDGHTASLFPDDEKNCCIDKPLFFAHKASELFQRVSISASFLAKTPRLIFLVSGEKKRPVMKKIFINNKRSDYLPVMNVIKKATGRVTVFCDQDAAPY